MTMYLTQLTFEYVAVPQPEKKEYFATDILLNYINKVREPIKDARSTLEMKVDKYAKTMLGESGQYAPTKAQPVLTTKEERYFSKNIGVPMYG